MYAGSRQVSEEVHASPAEAVQASLKGGRPVLLLGGPGAGKTSALKWLARLYAQEAMDGPASTVVPAYVDLGDFIHKESFDIVLEELRDNEEVLGQSQVLWLVDGLDLLLEEKSLNAREVLRRARTLQEKGSDSFILGSRDIPSLAGSLEHWDSSARIVLGTLDRGERQEWVKQFCPEIIRRLDKFERESQNARSFLNVPLLFAMMLSMLLDEQEAPFSCSQYPGKAGIFDGFVDYALGRATREGRISHAEADGIDWETMPGVYWAAVTSGLEDRFSASVVPRLCRKAFRENVIGERLSSWQKAVDVLGRAGLILRTPSGVTTINVLHQQFAEHWAAQHLAELLLRARQSGWFAAEMWDHLRERRFDPVVAQALAIVSKDDPEALREAFSLVSKVSIHDALEFMICTDNNAAFQIVLGVLESRDRVVRIAAMQALIRFNNQLPLDPIIGLLKDPDPQVCQLAAEALGVMNDPRAFETVLGLLKSSDPEMRRKALKVLGESKDPRAVNPLLGLLKDSDDELRIGVMWALGELKDLRAVEPLLALLIDSDLEGRMGVAYVIRKVKDPRAVEPLLTLLKGSDLRVRTGAAWVLGELKEPRAVEPLLGLLQDSDLEVRRTAAWALGECKDPRAVEPLLGLLKESNPAVRRSAAWALGKFKDPRAVEGLLGLLKDSDFATSGETVGVLATIKDPRAVEPLLSLLKDSDPGVRMEAVQGLGELKDPRAVEPLLSLLRDSDPEVRQRSVRVLGDLKDSRAVKPLLNLLKDSDGSVRRLAVQVLREFKDPSAVEPLLCLLNDSDYEVRWKAAGMLGQLKDPRAVEPLLHLLKDPDPAVRSMAANVLGEFKDPRAVEAVLDLLKDSDPGVRWQAAGLLGQLNDPRVVESLLALLKDSDPDVRHRSVKVLEDLKDPRAAEPLLGLLRDSDLEERERMGAACALGELKDPRAVEPLLVLLKNSDSKMRRSASEVLGKVRGSHALEDQLSRKDQGEELCDSDEVRPSANKYCGWLSKLGREVGLDYPILYEVLTQLGNRLEPWDDNLSKQRRRRREWYESQKGGNVTNNYNYVDNPQFTNCIVNIGSQLGQARQTLGASAVPDKNELSDLLKRLEEALTKLPPEKAELAPAAEAVATASKDLVEKASTSKPNPWGLNATAAGLKAAALAIKGVLPIAFEIANDIAHKVVTWFPIF
jgi:HEAT repeat protein